MSKLETQVMCDFECGELAAHDVRWGADEKQAAQVCEMHSREIWDATQSQISAGICFWTQEKTQQPQTKSVALA